MKGLVGGCGPTADTDVVPDASPLLLLWAGAAADTDGFS